MAGWYRDRMSERGYDPSLGDFAGVAAALWCGELRRGVALCGPTGSGKSVRLRILSRSLGVRMVHAVGLLDRLSRLEAGSQDWCAAIGTGGWNDITNPRWRDLAIDDLGSEPESVSSWGNRRDVMERVLIERHMAFEEHGALTHFSTNLTWAQLADRYGSRAASRLQQMCALVPLVHEDWRAMR